MAKAEWGTKRTCPSCGERFYDLQKDDPVVCINCGHEWAPEPILKTKQPIIVEQKPEAEKPDADESTDAEVEDDLDLDDDDEIGDVSLDDDDDEEVGAMVDTKLADDGES